MPAWSRQRDANEKSIVEALKRVGASVQRLGETGAPDLLVGFEGRTYLIEVKQERGKAGAGMRKSSSGLRDTQEKWWAEWRGSAPVVATTPEEALAVVGFVITDNDGNQVELSW